MPYLPLFTVLAVLLSAASAGGQESARDRAVELARKTLIDAKELAASAVTVRKVREVEWPDASLGCPEPGKSYAQVVTPGFAVFLDANGVLYAVHVGGGRAVLCERDQRGVARASKGDPGALFEGVAAARRELATELEIEERTVRIVSLERVRWTDPAQTCIKGLEMSEDVPLAGAVVTLGVEDQRFVVHLARGRSARCPPADPPKDDG